MLGNEITLAVDELNDANFTDHVFTRFEEFQNRSVYIGASHAMDARDTMSLYRTFPKPNGNFKGVQKSSAKFSVDTVVDGVDSVAQISAPIIIEVSFSIPVGATAAEILIARQRAVALVDLDAVMVPLNEQLMV